MRLLVDGTNVMASRPDGWWRDRPRAARRLLVQLLAWRRVSSEGLLPCDGEGLTVVDCRVVFDGRPLVDLPEGIGSEATGSDATGSDMPDFEVTVFWAHRSGPDAADDRIIEMLAADHHPSEVTVVTSDRRLAERARHLGAEVVGARWILERIEGADQ